MKQPIYPIFLPHAGCRSRCVFCQQHITSGQIEIPQPTVVAAQLDQMLPQAGQGEIAFYGGSFTLLSEPIQIAWLSLAAGFVSAGRVAGIRISTRPDAVNTESAAFLRSFNVTTVELGCQSFDAEVLRLTRRGHSSEAAAAAVAALRSNGLAIGLHLMPGLPGADMQEALTSLSAAIALQPDFLRIHPTVVLRGSSLESMLANGSYRPLTLDEATLLCARMLKICRAAGVPVIRLGLQGSDAFVDGHALVGGPYHPAFGQLVRSRLWLEIFVSTAKRFGVGPWRVHPSDLADAIGHRRSNLLELQRRFGAVSIVPVPEIDRDTVEIGGERWSIY